MKLRILLSLFVSALFLLLLLRIVPLEEILSSLKNISPEHILLAFLLYTASQITRSMRWKLVLKDLPFTRIFLINSANIFINNLLPARTGELSWFYYSSRMGVDLRSSLWAFFLGRAYDLLGLVCVILLTYTFIRSPFALALLLPLLLGIFALVPYSRELVPSFGKLSQFKEFLGKEFSPLLSVQLIFLSTLSFLLKAVSVFVLLREPDLFSFTLAFSGGELTSVLPIHSFMGYGTYETGFLIPLKLLGYDLKDSLKLGFVAHNFLLLSSTLWGVLSIGLLHTLSRKFP